MTRTSTTPLAGRTAVVTGSGQNIGKAIARLFAAAGSCGRAPADQLSGD